MASLTPGLVQLEGHLGWDVQNDLTLTPGGWCWLWVGPLWFSSMWPFILQEDRLPSIWSGLRVDYKKGQVEIVRSLQA